MPQTLTNWPPECRPEGAPVYTYNELAVAAPPERVWAWLVRATAWPSYYDNASQIRFVARERLAWRAKTVGGGGYHGWVILPTGAGCRVVTEETQRGIVPSVGRWLLRGGLLKQHQRWLEGLARVAAGGMPA